MRLHVSINVTDESGRTVSFGLNQLEIADLKRFAKNNWEDDHAIGDAPIMGSAGLDLLDRLRKLIDEWPT